MAGKQSSVVSGLAVSTSDLINKNPTYTDPYESAPSLKLANYFYNVPELGAYKPGRALGGLDWDSAASLMDLRSLSDYEVTVPSLALPDAMAMLPGKQNSVRTGSFEINMLDIPETLQLLTGQTIGQEQPLTGTAQGQNIVSDFALQFLNDYSTMPGKLLDYGIALPVTWGQAALQQSIHPNQLVNVDGSAVYKFQETNEYWNLLRTVSSDDQLMAIARQTASRQTGGALADALTSQLFDLMKRDRLKLTGLSSGNERIDYLSKMNLQAVMAMGSASGGQNVGLLNMLNPLDGAFLTMWDEAGKMALRGALTFIPFIGTEIASTIDPVRKETEAAWLKLSPNDRTGLAFNAQMQTLGYDLALSLPLFNGIGAVISVTKAGAAGSTFDSWLAAQAATNVSMQGALDVLKVGLAAGRTLPVGVQRAAFAAAARTTFDIPEVVAASRLWGIGESVARLAGPGMSLATPGRISIIPDGYDAVMALGRVMMAEGLAAWTANYALKAFMPGYSQTLGLQIDQSHWVSESSFAAVVDNIGLMAGGAFGAATLYRATKGAFGWTGERVGYKGSPVMDMWESQIGDVIDGQVTTAYARPDRELKQAFSNQILDVAQNHARDQIAQYAMKIWQADPTDAGMAKATDYLIRNASNAESVALDTLALIKNAADGSYGPAARNAAREAMQELAQTMEADSGVFRLAQRLYDRKLPYTPEGVKQWVAHTASFLGWDAAGAEKLAASIGKWNGLPRSERAQMDGWRKAANAVAQVAYNHFNGVLKGIVDLGTSAEAGLLHIVRVDHLFKPEAQRYIDLYKSFTDGKSTADEVEALKNQLMKTSEMREWYARKRPGKYEEPTFGERTLETASAKDVYNYVAQIKDSLDTKRVTPGPTSEVGPLNDLQLLLEQHGSWTLAFKPEEATALGVIKEQLEQARTAAAEWHTRLTALEKQMIDASNATYNKKMDLLVELSKKRIGRKQSLDAAEAAFQADRTERYAAYWTAKTEYDELIKNAAGIRAIHAAKKKMDALDAAYRTGDAKLAKAVDDARARLDAARDADKSYLALQEAERIAQEAYGLHRITTAPLEGRFGPVKPPDHVTSVKELLDSLDSGERHKLEGKLAEDARLAGEAMATDEGLWHVTTRNSMVQKHGLQDKEERDALGIKNVSGLGGGNHGISLTYSKSHAQAIESRIKESLAVAQGKRSLEDVIDYYYRRYPEVFDDPEAVIEAWQNQSYSIRTGWDAWIGAGHTPKDADAWQTVLELGEDFVQGDVEKLWDLFRMMDGKLGRKPGREVLILASAFPSHKVMDPAEVATLRVTVNGKPDARYSGDLTEIQVKGRDVFTMTALPDQPFRDPWVEPAADWKAAGALTRPVSYITTRDPVTGETAIFKAPYLQYPMSGADALNISNRNILARKMDEVFRGFRSWRITQYQRGQLFRIFTGTYEVTPEQVDAFAAGMGRLAWEKWSPVQGRGEMVMGAQAAARLRQNDVNELAARIFGKVDTGRKDANGNAIFEPAPMRNRVTGEMETPKWADMAADAYRQAWTINLTSGLTSRLYNINFLMMGHWSQLIGTWAVPTIRYNASPIFKASEIFESKGFNWMRMTKEVKPEDLAAYQSAGLGYTGIGAELRSGEMMGEIMALSSPSAPSASAAAVGLDSIQGSHRVASLLRADALKKGWSYITDPTPMKDSLETQMAVQTIGKEFPAILRAGDREAYNFYRSTLKVPDADIAKFIVDDRVLYQKWIDGTGTWAELEAHAAKYAPEAPPTVDMEAFYRSPEWATTQAMLRLAAKTAQQEAYGVHYFGSYRSAFERSINHPLLGVYPASWAYKAAKEWFKFLFDNHSFGDGALSLGAVPAAYLQQVMHAQSVAFAQFNDTDLQTWMRQGPLGNAMFVFNLLMPGDWSNIPFPASRSIRMLLRGEYDPVQHFMQNLFGPRGQGGIGAIRDLNMVRQVGTDVMDALTTSKGDSRWQKIIEGLDKNGNPPKPVDWDKVTKFPVPVVPQTLSEPIR